MTPAADAALLTTPAASTRVHVLQAEGGPGKGSDSAALRRHRTWDTNRPCDMHASDGQHYCVWVYRRGGHTTPNARTGSTLSEDGSTAARATCDLEVHCIVTHVPECSAKKHQGVVWQLRQHVGTGRTGRGEGWVMQWQRGLSAAGRAPAPRRRHGQQGLLLLHPPPCLVMQAAAARVLVVLFSKPSA